MDFRFTAASAGQECAKVLTGDAEAFRLVLESHDMDNVVAKMQTRSQEAAKAAREYDPLRHEIMERPNKVIVDEAGEYRRTEEVWRLPVSYPSYINEVALVFLYGRPVKWLQKSEGTDAAFAAFCNVLQRIKFDSKIRQCKRLAGAETEAALLFGLYKDKDGKAQPRARVLANSKGDTIYTRFDEWENLTAFAWTYFLQDKDGGSEKHCEVYTAEREYKGILTPAGWQVEEKENLLGKIPVILFQQQKEWAGVEPLIRREEYIASHTADTNDYFADPVMILASDRIAGMPSKKDEAKTLLSNGGGLDVAKYLTWDSAPQSKKDELDWLQDQILSKTFTPRISLDTLQGLGNLSGKALRTVMLLADMKAAKHKETHDEMLDRTASLITAMIAKVLDISLATECEAMQIGHEFQNPFGDDTSETIAALQACKDGGLMSAETAIEMNPLVTDTAREKDRVAAEKEENPYAGSDMADYTEAAAGEDQAARQQAEDYGAMLLKAPGDEEEEEEEDRLTTKYRKGGV